MRRCAVFLAAAGFGFGVLIGGPGGAPPAQSAAVTTITGWSAFPVSATVGYALPVSVLVRTGSTYVTRTLVVQRRKAGFKAWTQVSSQQTAGNATVWLTAPAVGAWDFRLVVPATSSAAAASTAPRRVVGVSGLATTIYGWHSAPVNVPPGTLLSAKLYVMTGTTTVPRQVQIQRRATTGTAWTTVATGTTSSGSYRASFGAPVGAWYFRVVVPVSQIGQAAQSAERPVTVRDDVPPGPVIGLAVTGKTRTSISLAWINPVSPDLAAVIVRRAEGPTPPSSATAGMGVSLPSPTATSVVSRGLVPGTQYSYAVFTRDTAGNTRTPGVTVTDQTWPAMRLKAVTGGHAHTCGLGPAGKAWCWGDDTYGQLGDGVDDRADEFSPVAVAGGRVYTMISAGMNHTCALTVGGQVWCWGSDGAGQLGDGADGPSVEDAPVAVAGGLKFVAITSGYGYTCAITLGGIAWCWGDDFFGQLGNGASNVDQHSPVAVAGGHTFSQITAAQSHTCALRQGGTAWCWGSEASGKLGNGSDGPGVEEVPVAVTGGRTFFSITAGSAHTCALDLDMRAWCWGSDKFGQVGDGPSNQGLRFEPVPVSGGHQFTKLTATSWAHTCGLDLTAKPWCWGADGDGQLGDGTAPNQGSVPVRVLTGRTMTTISAGYVHSCAVDSNANAWCWGSDHNGQLGDGDDGQARGTCPSG